MTGEIVTVFGGSGFLGRNIVRELASAGYRVRVATRNPNSAMFLQPMGTPGQIGLFQANLRDEDSVRRVLKNSHAVINLVGLLFEAGKQQFRSIHVEGAERIARLATEAGVVRAVHVSAIGADLGSPSRYARTKAEGETAFRRAYPEATIIRPSIVFGPEDDFFNKFADMARFAPALPLIGGGKTRFQPIHVDDVADAVVKSLTWEGARGRIFEVGGPQILTFRECLEMMLRHIHRKRALVPLPFMLAHMIAFFASLSPFGAPLLTNDQVRLLRRDNVVGESGDATVGRIEDFGIKPVAADVILPTYLYRFRPKGQYEKGY